MTNFQIRKKIMWREIKEITKSLTDDNECFNLSPYKAFKCHIKLISQYYKCSLLGQLVLGHIGKMFFLY